MSNSSNYSKQGDKCFPVTPALLSNEKFTPLSFHLYDLVLTKGRSCRNIQQVSPQGDIEVDDTEPKLQLTYCNNCN